MLADKKLKPSPTAMFMARINEFCKWLAAPPAVPPDDGAGDWYTGLCVDPRGFSNQLGKLQIR